MANRKKKTTKIKAVSKKTTTKKATKKASKKAKATAKMAKATKKVAKATKKAAKATKMAKTTTKKATAKAAAKKTVAKKPAAKKATTKAATLAHAKLLEGTTLPSFKVPAIRGQIVSNEDFKDKKVVLFFYPKDMTPGCTIEGREFSELKGHFAVHNTLVFGVSKDSVASHEKFVEKENYTVDLLSDEDETLCKIFDVIKEKNMSGKAVRGIERSTFLVDEHGKIIKEWRGVKAPQHAAEVLKFLETLKQTAEVEHA